MEAMMSIGGLFGDLDFSLASDDEEPVPETLPTPGSAKLVIEDKCEALFFSAEWTIRATVGKHELAASTPRDKTHTGPFIKRWTRQMIRSNKARLRRLGVDVEATYLFWGGVLEDLDD
jgi:hypothetical protein